MVKSKNKADVLMDLINKLVLCVFSFCMLIPLLNVLSVSISSPQAVDAKKVFLWPVELTMASWQHILSMGEIWKSAGLTLFATIVGTVLAIIVSALMAYPLSKKEFPFSKMLVFVVLLTMIFKAPTIPYFLTLSSYGLVDSILVLIVPHILQPYNLLIMISFFRSLPHELEEAAVIDGCGLFRLWGNVVIPCSKQVISTMALFYAVLIWNQFSHPLMFINDSSLYPLQMKIKQLISGVDLMGMFAGNASLFTYNNETLRAVVVLFSVVPIACVYPFVQKYFVKGAMLGSVKG